MHYPATFLQVNRRTSLAKPMPGRTTLVVDLSIGKPEATPHRPKPWHN